MTEDTSLPPAMAVLWRRDEDRPRPGRRPALTLEGIAAEAIALADADGLASVSMARVAERLGVTTMALYRYVGSKDELLGVMSDVAMAPPPLPDDGPWRDRLEAWCHAQLAAVRAHPWAVETATRWPMGPNRLRWLESGLAALAGTALPVGLRTTVVGMLSLHVLTEGQLLAAVADANAGRATEHPALVDYDAVLRLVADPDEHPHVVEAVGQGAFGPTTDPGDYDAESNLALAMLLDGVEALVRRHEAAGQDTAGTS